jgi:hypothetical protein
MAGPLARMLEAGCPNNRGHANLHQVRARPAVRRDVLRPLEVVGRRGPRCGGNGSGHAPRPKLLRWT